MLTADGRAVAIICGGPVLITMLAILIAGIAGL